MFQNTFKYFMIISLFSSQLVLASTFGYSGSDGRDGSDATDGHTPAHTIIYADGSSQSYDLRGGDASHNAEDGSAGSDASSCYQPTEDYDVYGADGGDGGDGGNGGDGGDGGSITVFYKNLSSLSNIEVISTPGVSTPGAQGSYGGNACRCNTYSWSREYCYDDTVCHTEKICNPVQKCHKEERCKTVDGQRVCVDRDVCERVTECDNVTRCEDIVRCENRNYSCSDGSDGRDGSDGSHGYDGSYGSIKLVKDLEEIPQDSPYQSYKIAQIVNQTKTLSQNIWETKSGAQNLFAANSDISNTYSEFIETATNTVGVDWTVSKPIAQFQDIQFNLAYSSLGPEIQIKTQHLLKKRIEKSGSHTQVIIEQAYKVSDVNQLSASHQGRKNKFEIVITDKASLSQIVENKVHLNLELKQLFGYKTLFSGYVPANKMIVSADKIIIKAGELSSDSKPLKKNRKIKYSIDVTRSYEGSQVSVPLYQGKIKVN